MAMTNKAVLNDKVGSVGVCIVGLGNSTAQFLKLQNHSDFFCIFFFLICDAGWSPTYGWGFFGVDPGSRGIAAPFIFKFSWIFQDDQRQRSQQPHSHKQPEQPKQPKQPKQHIEDEADKKHSIKLNICPRPPINSCFHPDNTLSPSVVHKAKTRCGYKSTDLQFPRNRSCGWPIRAVYHWPYRCPSHRMTHT